MCRFVGVCFVAVGLKGRQEASDFGVPVETNPTRGGSSRPRLAPRHASPRLEAGKAPELKPTGENKHTETQAAGRIWGMGSGFPAWICWGGRCSDTLVD